MDKLIKQKIDTLSDLPTGYEANLDSKWQVLHTALHQPKKQKSFAIWRYAAIFCVLAVLGWGIFQFNKQQIVAVQNKVHIQNSEPATSKYAVASDDILIDLDRQNNISIPPKADSKLKQHLPETLQELVIVSEDEIQLAAPVAATQNNVRKRFVEVTFASEDTTNNMVAIDDKSANNSNSTIKFSIGRKAEKKSVAAQPIDPPQNLLSFSKTF